MSSLLKYICIFVYLISFASGALAASDDETVNVRVDRVTFNPSEQMRMNLYVSVFDSSGLAVTDLTRENFRLKEDGIPYSSTFHTVPFVVTERDLSFLLMVDNNENLATSLTLVRRSANEFVCEMGFRYTGALLTYGDSPNLLVKPTKDAYRLTLAIDSLAPVSGRPRLGEALLMGIDALNGPIAGPEQTVERRAIILLTEGRDEASMFSLEAAATKLVESGACLFVIGYGLVDTPTMKLLADLATRTGGDAFFSSQPDDLEHIFANVADRLKHQYVITYIPKRIGLDGRHHRLSVQVEQEDYRGQARFEFVSPSNDSGFPLFPIVLIAVLLGVSLIGVILILRQSLVTKNKEKYDFA